MSSRAARVLGPITKAMRVIEIGPSHAPLAPKAEGWLTTVVDHASEHELKAKYGTGSRDVSKIEAVDCLWEGGPLAEAFPQSSLGGFDGLIASHVIEHIPDLIGFLLSAAVLLDAKGVIALAIPDKRYCFDHLKPITLTGDLLAAHADNASRHTGRTAFNHVAYSVSRDGKIGWNPGAAGEFRFVHSLQQAAASFKASRVKSAPYSDYHCWHFTPASFELVILELNVLGAIPWSIQSIERTAGAEFYAHLAQAPAGPLSPAELDGKRLRLLSEAWND